MRTSDRWSRRLAAGIVLAATGGLAAGCADIERGAAAADTAGGGADAGDVAAGDGAGDACGCPAGTACVRGVCLDGCDGALDAAALEAALAPGWVPVSQHCRTPGAAYVGLADGRVAELVASPTEAGTRLEVDVWSLDDGAAAPALVADVLAAEVYPGSYLREAPEGGTLAFGYTGAFDPSGLTPGEVLVGDAAGGEVAAVDAPGNYSAALLDAETVLVNGLGAAGAAGEQGLWAATWDAGAGAWAGVRVATGLGSASGGVAVAGDVVLAGGYAGFGTTWPDGTEGNRVFALPVAELLAAAAGTAGPVDAFAAGTELALGFDFEVLDAARVVTREVDASFATAGLTVHTLGTSGGAVAVTGSAPLATGAALDAARALPGTSRLLLRHAAGYLAVEPGGR